MKARLTIADMAVMPDPSSDDIKRRQEHLLYYHCNEHVFRRCIRAFLADEKLLDKYSEYERVAMIYESVIWFSERYQKFLVSRETYRTLCERGGGVESTPATQNEASANAQVVLRFSAERRQLQEMDSEVARIRNLAQSNCEDLTSDDLALLDQQSTFAGEDSTSAWTTNDPPRRITSGSESLPPNLRPVLFFDSNAVGTGPANFSQFVTSVTAANNAAAAAAAPMLPPGRAPAPATKKMVFGNQQKKRAPAASGGQPKRHK
jgi:hypothetical protein